MEIHDADRGDCAGLARMNRELIEDEGHENPMSTAELGTRMEGFLTSGYRAFLFREEGETVGYALVDTTRSPLYLRQFFIARGHRRRGYGREAFRLLLGRLGADTIDIEVLYWNEAGLRFWESLGFRPRSLYMRYREE
ncbi:MAG: GNAT family N-acetyltransferase [Clostridia bacterium]|nr:GNAT family N-acetyltransferase [Clostridia bacterium]